MNIYGILRRGTIDTSTVVKSGKDINIYKWLKKNGYHRTSTADYYGYVETDWCYLFEYDGRYGTGYVACTHAYKYGKTSTRTFTLEYWIK